MLKVPNKLFFSPKDGGRLYLGAEKEEGKRFLTMVSNFTNDKTAQYLNEIYDGFCYLDISKKHLFRALTSIYVSQTNNKQKHAQLKKGIWEKAKIWARKIQDKKLIREDFLSYSQTSAYIYPCDFYEKIPETTPNSETDEEICSEV